MLKTKSALISMTCCLGWALPLAASAENCVPTPGREPIRVSVGADKMPAVSAESVTACEGETLRWVFQGGAREFAILFVSAEDSPFEWSRQKGATVSGTVKAGAAKDAQKTEYKYDVEVDGKVLDPRIIIER